MRTAIAPLAVHDGAGRPLSPIKTAPRRADATRIGVLIIDDDGRSGYSLWALLNWQAGIAVCMATSADAPGVIRQERPAVCLVSACLGLRYVHRLTRLPDASRVLVYADRRTAELDGMMAIAGADGIIWRYGDPGQLVNLIRRAATGRGAAAGPAAGAIDGLLGRVEDRDRPIAAMLLLRTPVDEIARTLGISASALRARRHELLRRLDDAGQARVLRERLRAFGSRR
jgi:DNA-binding NarL/FixJ family response regulator